MNMQNVQAAINIMKRAGRVNMINWQGTTIDENHLATRCVSTEQELHACGNSACFAGWVAVSPEWKEFGGVVGDTGYPDLPNESFADDVISKWLGISDKLASCFIFGGMIGTRINLLNSHETFSVFYGKKWGDVNARDVIEKLEYLKVNGELLTIQKYLESLIAFDLNSLNFSYIVKGWFDAENEAVSTLINNF